MIGLAACSRPPAVAQTPASVPVAEYRPGSSVTNTTEAEMAGRQLIERPLMHWIGVPRLALAEESSYADAAAKIGAADPEYANWAPDTRVWLTIFEGQWDLTPIDPNNPSPQPVRYEGCVLVVFQASNGEMISMGDSRCPGAP